MKYLKNMKRPQLGTILASLALIVALGGTATAASGLINGKKIKNNTVAGKKLKNKTITKNKLAPKTVKALKGQKGPQGAPGKDGVVSPVSEVFGSLNIPASTAMGLGAVPVPAGKYMVTGTFDIGSTATTVVTCTITANNGGGSHTARFDPDGGGTVTIPSQLVTSNSEVTQFTAGCQAGNSSANVSGTLIATPVQ